MPEIIYLCDGKSCPKCDPELCKHTSNIEHAISFSLEGNIWVEKENKTADVEALKAKVEELQKELIERPYIYVPCGGVGELPKYPSPYDINY